jgi:hypothetical protein
MSEWQLRLRGLLERNLAVVVLALVVLAAVGGWVTYTTHVAPDTTTEQRVVATWETRGQFDHGATVREENAVFPVGSRLQNRSVYFTRVAPVLNGTYAFDYRASQGGELSGNVTVSLVVRGVETEGDSATVLWQTSRLLEERRVESLAPGESVTVPFAVNVSRVAARTDRIAEGLGGSPGTVQTRVRASVGFAGRVNGDPVERTATHALSLQPEGARYRVADAGPTTEEYESTATVTVDRTYGPLRRFGGPLLLVGALVAEVALAVWTRNNRLALSDAEREWLAYRDDRAEFDEWITSFELPAATFELPSARAASLGDLVDFAIDVDSGVVEVDEGAFVVVHDGVRYEYRAPENPTDAAAGGEDPLGRDRDRLGDGESPDERTTTDVATVRGDDITQSDRATSEADDDESLGALFGESATAEAWSPDELAGVNSDDAAVDDGTEPSIGSAESDPAQDDAESDPAQDDAESDRNAEFGDGTG